MPPVLPCDFDTTGTPDICIAETAGGGGVTLGNGLAAALVLTVAGVGMPY